MIVRIFPSDESGCGFYRMLEPARVVAALTTEVEVQIVSDVESDLSLDVRLAGKIGNERVVAVMDPECDVIVLQRPAHRHLIEAIPYLQAHGVAVVCDYDDDFDSIDPRNPAWGVYDPNTSPLQNNVWAKLGSSLADMVTVTTQGLAKKYGAHGHVAVLPNYVPESYLKVEPKWDEQRTYDRDVPRIGWAGHPKTHPGDLEITGTSLRELELEDRAIFRTVGSTGTPKVTMTNRFEVLDWVPIDEFFRYVASFDIGIVPLRDSTFNKSKSWLKGLEYAALGVPFVASPTKPYRELAALGAGDLVTTTTTSTSAWKRTLGKLLEDSDYREQRSAEGRSTATQLTYEGNGERWLVAWANALSVRRAT